MARSIFNLFGYFREESEMLLKSKIRIGDVFIKVKIYALCFQSVASYSDLNRNKAV